MLQLTILLRTVRHESRRMSRERGVWIGLACLAAVTSYGVVNGSRVTEQLKAREATIRTQEQDRLRTARASIVDPYAVSALPSTIALPASALGFLAVGQSDLLYLLPDRPADAKEQLAGAIDQAAKAITEGRDAVQGLRSSTTEKNNLALAISALETELPADGSGLRPAFHVTVEGETRELHPILRDEIYKIAAEALRNAFRHAHAGRVEVEKSSKRSWFSRLSVSKRTAACRRRCRMSGTPIRTLAVDNHLLVRHGIAARK
jgi:signal transduction histidine kinase